MIVSHNASDYLYMTVFQWHNRITYIYYLFIIIK